jgi:hypothetical protein
MYGDRKGIREKEALLLRNVIYVRWKTRKEIQTKIYKTGAKTETIEMKFLSNVARYTLMDRIRNIV